MIHIDVFVYTHMYKCVCVVYIERKRCINTWTYIYTHTEVCIHIYIEG